MARRQGRQNAALLWEVDVLRAEKAAVSTGLGQVQAEARALRLRLRGVPQLEEDHERLVNCLGESELEVEDLQEQLAAADAARASAEQVRFELEQVGLV